MALMSWPSSVWAELYQPKGKHLRIAAEPEIVEGELRLELRPTYWRVFHRALPHRGAHPIRRRFSQKHRPA